MNTYHIPVLLHEAIDSLTITSGMRYIDATLGGGGYTLEIAKRGGIVLSLDVDSDAIIHTKNRITNEESWASDHVTIVQSNFRDIRSVATTHGFSHVHGIVADLGVSSHQLEESHRGFSFRKNAHLDMRMDQSLQTSAKDLVNSLSAGELTATFMGFGQEKYAKKIADLIVLQREKKPIETTEELAQLALGAYPKGKQTIHPATKIFQALRIAVNDELGSLKTMLPEAIELLLPGGRFVVVSFHSLEDEIVKDVFQTFEKNGIGRIVNKKVITPNAFEIVDNPKSRSAKMRIFEKNKVLSS